MEPQVFSILDSSSESGSDIEIIDSLHQKKDILPSQSSCSANNDRVSIDNSVIDNNNNNNNNNKRSCSSSSGKPFLKKARLCDSSPERKPLLDIKSRNEKLTTSIVECDAASEIAPPGHGLFCKMCERCVQYKFVVALDCSDIFCSRCIRQRAAKSLQTSCEFTCPPPPVGCGKEISAHLAREAGVKRSTIDAINERKLRRLLSADSSMVHCPREGCGNIIQKIERSGSQALMSLPKTAPDGSLLNTAASLHMVKYRFLCHPHGCGVSFCSSCNQSPYHIGKTCEEASRDRAAVPCRFCTAPLPSASAASKGSQLRPYEAVCDEDECQQRLLEACDKILSCGHVCCGVLGESSCPPCLFCKGEQEDYCAICYVESLQAAPITQLACGHYYHLHCIRTRLEKKWPTARISFNFADCATCKAPVAGEFVDSAMKSIYKLKTKVITAAVKRLRLVDKKESIKGKGKKKSGEEEATQKEKETALKRFNYYLCSKCNRPYFGGEAACGEAAAHGDDAAQEMTCGACSAKEAGWKGVNCTKHGDQYIEFKCRFCCEVATFFCFGHTHFCESCHLKWCKKASQRNFKGGICLVKKCSCNEKHPENGTTKSSEHCCTFYYISSNFFLFYVVFQKYFLTIIHVLYILKNSDGCSLCRIGCNDNAPLEQSDDESENEIICISNVSENRSGSSSSECIVIV